MPGYMFDARQYQPQQSMPSHPIGQKFRAMIIKAECKGTKDGGGGYLQIDFQTEAGRISKRYNFWNQSVQAVEIANKEFSALCHATGIYVVEIDAQPLPAPQLMQAQLLIDVSQQVARPGQDPKTANYVEVSKVYDLYGNEPGAAPQGQMAAQPHQPPAQPPANGQWQQPPAPQAPAPQTAPQWQQPQQQQPQPGFAPPAATPFPGATPPPSGGFAPGPQTQQAPQPQQPQGQWQQPQAPQGQQPAAPWSR